MTAIAGTSFTAQNTGEIFRRHELYHLVRTIIQVCVVYDRLRIYLAGNARSLPHRFSKVLKARATQVNTLTRANTI
jgi:4-diphosphocytidyl-2C-methyl-D-erythritol kinase